MSEIEAVAFAAKREAYAMCKGCPLTPGQIKAFVARWVAGEIAWHEFKAAKIAKGEWKC